MQLVLARMRPSKLARTLRLRFGLDAADDSSSGKEGCQQGEILDFRAVGQQMGVSSAAPLFGRLRSLQVFMLHFAVWHCQTTCVPAGTPIARTRCLLLRRLLWFACVQVSRQRAQQLYHTAISSARSTAAAAGLV